MRNQGQYPQSPISLPRKLELRILSLVFLSGAVAMASLVGDVRQAVARNDFAAAEKVLEGVRSQKGVTPEWLEAHSWLGRGALAAKDLDRALAYAGTTRKLALEQLGSRGLDDERRLPIALGASIEVQAQAMAARGERAEAVAFLRRELETWRTTSVRTRIQKNLNLLTLEGQPAPPLETSTSLGGPTPGLAALKGRPVLLFFWAHWCGDCKNQVPILARLSREFASRGLTIIGPTQRYGYVARGEEAGAEKETAYIEEIRKRSYAEIPGMTVPVSEENFRTYGASTTPTLVLVDAKGVVRAYSPGNVTYEQLAARIGGL
jgi:thiol-disulfide isomerase/thioredoxin